MALPITLFQIYSPWNALQAQHVAVGYLQHKLTLKIPQIVHGDGGAVVFNPQKKVYYCSFFGAQGSPLFMFDSLGKYAQAQTQIGLDCRALWYNAKQGCLEGSASEVEEYFQLTLDGKGAPEGLSNIYTGTYHIFELGMGSWVAGKSEVWYYANRFVHRYRVRKDNEPALFELELDDHYFDVNAFAMVYTGLRGAEVGLYDYVKNRVLLFSKRNGKLRRILNISHVNSPRPSSAGFSYSNGMFWLYDNAEGSWWGYGM